MPRIPNPAGGLMKRVDNTLESVDGVLGRVDGTLSSVDVTLKEVGGTLTGVDQKLGTVDKTLANVDEKLGTVDETLGEVSGTLESVKGLLTDLEEEMSLLKRLPEMAAKLDEVHAAVTGSASDPRAVRRSSSRARRGRRCRRIEARTTGFATSRACTAAAGRRSAPPTA